MSLAAWFGKFIGTMLAECAPVIVAIISEAIRDAATPTVETSSVPDDVKNRLKNRLRDWKIKHGIPEKKLDKNPNTTRDNFDE